MLRRRTFPVALVFSSLALEALALPPEGELWLAVETPRVVVATNGPVELAREVSDAFETLYDSLAQIVGGESLGGLGRSVVLVFRDPASLAPYWQPNVPVHQPGFVTIGEETSFAVLDGSVQSGLRRSVHKQFLLQILHQDYPTAPLWLRYGLAEYLSSLERTGRRVTIGNIGFHQLDTVDGNEIELEWPEVLGAPALPSDPAGSRSFVRQSTLLVHYLLGQALEERRRFADFLHRIGAGEDQESAWRTSFGRALSTLGPAADAYLASGELMMLAVTLPAEVTREPAVRPLAPAESLVLLGELLVRFGPRHRAAALEHLVAASVLDPENGALWKRRATLHRLGGEKGEAYEALTRAAALLPEDLALQLDAAVAFLEQVPRDRALEPAEKARLAAVRAILTRVTAAEPDNVSAWTALAAAWSHEPLPPQEGLAAFERAFALAPERVDFAYNALLGRVRKGDAAGAETLLTALEAKPADPLILDRARNALASLDLKEAVRLARAGKTSEATFRYARVLARATDPALVQPAATALAQAAKASRERVFVEAYLNVIRLFEAGEREAGRQALENLAATAQPGNQAMAVAALRGRWGG
jgi:tetratricopeptide (TPR) repeat protein